MRRSAQEAQRVVTCREEYLLRRKDRLQVEILLEAQARHRRIEVTRREQRTLDDWFAIQARLRRRYIR